MVGRLLAFLEDVGHAEGVAHFDEPITQSRREAIVDAVESARLPRGDELLFFVDFHFLYLVASNAETDLRPDAQSRNHGFVLVVLGPFAEIDVEEQWHINIMRLFQVADSVVVFANPLFELVPCRE